jgi:hypothetical protein
MMLVMSGGLVEFVFQRAHAVHAVDELEVPTPLIVQPGIMNDGVTNRLVYVPGDVQRHARVVEPLGPGILIHDPQDRARLTEHSADPVEDDRLAIGEVVQDVLDRPLAGRVGPSEVTLVEREVRQRLFPRPLQIPNELCAQAVPLACRARQMRAPVRPHPRRIGVSTRATGA